MCLGAPGLAATLTAGAKALFDRQKDALQPHYSPGSGKSDHHCLLASETLCKLTDEPKSVLVLKAILHGGEKKPKPLHTQASLLHHRGIHQEHSPETVTTTKGKPQTTPHFQLLLAQHFGFSSEPKLNLWHQKHF